MIIPTLTYELTDDPEYVSVDLNKLVLSKLLVQASSGGGKSRAIRQLLEQTHGRVQHIVFDPEGEYATLREQFPYLLAATEGDLPADPQAARLLCRRVMELGASIVIDLFDLDLTDRRRYVRDFIDELMSLPRDLWHPTLVVIDEAQMFVPQGSPSESSSAIIKLASQGRKRGYGLILATQRLSAIDKDAAAECLNNLIGKADLDLDRRRAAERLGFTRAESEKLRKLSAGEFYVYGPAISSDVQLIKTGPVITTHPDPSMLGSAPPPPPPAAIKALLQQLQDLPEQVIEETHTLEGLRETITDLRQQLAARPVETKIETKIEYVDKIQYVDVPMLADDQVKRLEDAAAALIGMAKDLMATAGEISAKIRLVTSPSVINELHEPIGLEDELIGLVRDNVTFTDMVTAQMQLPKHRGPLRSAPTAPPLVLDPPSNTGLSGPQMRILGALASFEALGIKNVTRSNIAVYADQSPRSSGYGNNLSALKTRGLIEYPTGGLVCLTDQGHLLAPQSPKPLTRAELHRAWFGKVSGPQGRILQCLITIYPGSISRDELARSADQSATSSGYGNNLSALKTLGLITYPSSGRVVATDLLFPKGLK